MHAEQRRRERREAHRPDGAQPPGSGGSLMPISAPVPIPAAPRDSRLIVGIHEGEGEDEDADNDSSRSQSRSDVKPARPLASPSPTSSSPSPQAAHPPPHPRTASASHAQRDRSLQILPSHTPPLQSADSTPDSTPSTGGAAGDGLRPADSELESRMREREQAAAARRHSTPDLSQQVRSMRRPASSSNLSALDKQPALGSGGAGGGGGSGSGGAGQRRSLTSSRLQGAGKVATSPLSSGRSVTMTGTPPAAGHALSALRSHSFPDQDELTLLTAAPMGDSRRPSLSHSISLSSDERHFASPVLSSFPSSLSQSASASSPQPPSFPSLSSSHGQQRVATIILPDHVSTLTLQTAQLPTIRQVKEEALLTLYRRGVLLLPPDLSLVQMMDEWMLCVEREGEEMRVADEMKVESLSLQDRRLSASAPSASASSLTLYLHHAPPSVTPTDQLQHYTELLSGRIAALSCSSPSSTIIVEGDVGLGKTKLLSTAVTPASSSHAHCIWSLANPFDSQRPLSVFRDVLLPLCDEEVMRVGVSEYSELSQAENRRRLIAQKLRRRRRFASGRESLWSVAGCLNEVITGLDMEETDESLGMERDERIHWSMLCLINVLHAVASVHPLLLIIDEAVWLDHFSWQVVLSLSRLPAGLLLVLATRPINRSNMAAFQTQIPLEYTTLLQEQHTSVVSLQPRSDEVVYQLMCEMLGEGVSGGAVDVPAGLASFVIRKAHGNPLVVKELVYVLTHDKLVEVDGQGKISLSPSLPLASAYSPHLVLSLSLPIPVPLTLSSILGSRLDRLGYAQRMLLKCCAVIGEEVGEKLLVRMWEGREREQDGRGGGGGGGAEAGEGGSREEVMRELAGLLEMNVLRRGYGYEERERWEAEVGQAGAGGGGSGAEAAAEAQHERVKYTFTHGFMREVVLSRMLDAQKKELELKLQEARQEIVRRKTDFLFTGSAAPASAPMPIPPTVQPHTAAGPLNAFAAASLTYHPSTPPPASVALQPLAAAALHCPSLLRAGLDLPVRSVRPVALPILAVLSLLPRAPSAHDRRLLASGDAQRAHWRVCRPVSAPGPRLLLRPVPRAAVLLGQRAELPGQRRPASPAGAAPGRGAAVRRRGARARRAGRVHGRAGAGRGGDWRARGRAAVEGRGRVRALGAGAVPADEHRVAHARAPVPPAGGARG